MGVRIHFLFIQFNRKVTKSCSNLNFTSQIMAFMSCRTLMWIAWNIQSQTPVRILIFIIYSLKLALHSITIIYFFSWTKRVICIWRYKANIVQYSQHFKIHITNRVRWELINMQISIDFIFSQLWYRMVHRTTGSDNYTRIPVLLLEFRELHILDRPQSIQQYHLDVHVTIRLRSIYQHPHGIHGLIFGTITLLKHLQMAIHQCFAIMYHPYICTIILL